MADEAQHMRALGKANRVRADQGAVREALRRGHLTLAEALHHPLARSDRIERLLRAQMGWYKGERVTDLLRSLNMAWSGHKQIEELTDRQVSAIIAVVEGRKA